MSSTTSWEQKTMEKLLLESLREKRRSRRWGIFFKLFLLTYLFAVLFLFFPFSFMSSPYAKPHTALIDIKGGITADSEANADDIAASLQEAMSDPNTKGLILRINSPGGSPVQADYIFNEIMRQRSKHPKIKIYAVCTDLCASAAYYIAAAADDIYANPSSLVGSIGVLLNGFGFVDTMKKVGVSRRLITAGAHKGFLDPFSPMKPGEEKYAQQLVDTIHKQFIARVKQGRGKRLVLTDNQIFSGLIWTGAEAKKLGLVDNFGSAGYVAREVVGYKAIANYSPRPGFIDKITKVFGKGFARGFVSDMGVTVR